MIKKNYNKEIISNLSMVPKLLLTNNKVLLLILFIAIISLTFIIYYSTSIIIIDGKGQKLIDYMLKRSHL